MALAKCVFTSITAAIMATAVLAIPAPLQFDKRDSFDKPVTWDNHTLMINGERLFLYSGEFHYYRLPSPGLWVDIMEKFKALDFNGVSFYFYWGYHSPKKGIYDFSGVRDVQKAIDAATQADLEIITRPGPYINAEVDGGGFPGWTKTQRAVARKNSTENNENWSEWLSAIDAKIVPNQITHGGRVILNQIDNEYAANTDEYYMEAIKEQFLKDGMDVPTIFNDPNTGAHFVHGIGAPDIYGWDSYPAGFDCSNPDVWPNNANFGWYDYHMANNPDQPVALYEFQGGAFDPWGGPGYDACRKMVSERYAKVYYKNNYANGARIQNLYMGYGGTSWGGIAIPSVYTSYDYGAPISEPGLMTPKAHEVRLQGTFLHTVKPFLSADRFNATVDNDDIHINGWIDQETGTKVYIVQHEQTNSTELTKFHISVDSKAAGKTINIPRSSKLVLNGRDAKMLVADYAFNSQELAYATSEIFTHQSMGSFDVLLVYAYEKEEGEFALKTSKNAQVQSKDKSVKSKYTNGLLQVNYRHPKGTTPISIQQDTTDLLVLVAGYDSATKWWAPIVDKDRQQRVLVHGPYLVRSARIQGSTLSLRADIDETTDIQIVAPDSVTQFEWNGKAVELTKSKEGIWQGKLKFTQPKVEYTDLSKAKWQYQQGSPESEPDFDDSDWIKADHLETNSITPHVTYPVLFADDYGFHTGSLWFRGTFNGSDAITGFNLTANTGTASAWVAWLNGKYLGGFESGNQAFTDLGDTLKSDGENVISLLVWTVGNADDWNANDAYKEARGFTMAQLLGVSNQTIWSIDWKVQGNLGGEDLADPVRGPYNEGGLYGERKGWHLPDFETDDAWKTASVPESKNRSGVSWYRTEFEVNVPEGYDVPMGLRFKDKTDQRYRALVFLNGWQLGRYANDLGPQELYYLPEGILNTSGKNTLALAVIPLDEAAQVGEVVLEPYGVLQSAKPKVDLVESPGYDKSTRG